MNDIHDIEGPIKILYQNNDFSYFVVLITLIIILVIFFLLKKIKKNYSKNYLNILIKRINQLNIDQEDVNKILDEISNIIKEYIKYKKNINTESLTTYEISNILENQEIVYLLEKIDYMKYSYIEFNKEDLVKIIDKLKLIIE